MRGTRNRPSSASGAAASTSSRGRPGRATSARNTFTNGSGCAVGGTPCGVERRHLRRVLEDRPELGRERVELVVGERQARELRHVLDLVTREGMFGHDGGRYLYGSSLLSGNSHHSSGPGDQSGSG